MKVIAVVAACALAGCMAGASEIVPAGKDSYMVAGKAVGGPEAGQSMIEATKAANAFCAKQSKVMIIRHTETSGIAGLGGEHSNLIFSCVAENDPEYTRPNLK